jgi:hypothetical protein
MLNTEIKNKIAIKIMGTCLPALRNKNGLVIAQTGLGCSPMPQANLPKGNAGRIPKKKNTVLNTINRNLLCTWAFIKSPIPARQKIALTQTRGNNKTSRKPIDLRPPPAAHVMSEMHSKIATAHNTVPKTLCIGYKIFI